ncbi:glycosyltransferase family 4 protein [Nocardioides sp. STR2]|uniref:Glycosyltransferase family 4 protein n=1 Tax=Nocardioides pini TaxID=2975053 RepID=A0ABT4CDC4_9ACTN|nr:glycosyltransferase family 4 protein [Nocardioides pini]MCY4726967.1 glycosyltransferase family 4 protein [Nocardioides pini]
MRVIVYPHAMELGGSQLNAIELASGVQALGHDVTLYADPGDLVSYAQARGLEVITRRRSPLCPSPERVVELRRLAARRSAQILHGYEWPPILECHAASWGRPQLAPVGTVMSMGVAGFIPRSSPLVVGTERLRRRTAEGRPGPVLLMEPPVDTVANAPGTNGAAFRASLPPAPGYLVVIVSRLAHELKLEGILTAIRCIGDMAHRRDVRLVIVGDGPARRVVEEAAAAANRGHASDAVILTGALEDPRGAYDAADVCIAMGGSALRAMAFGKPLIVQGERGFFQTVTAQTVPLFLEQGWYGQDHLDREEAAARLAGLVCELLDDPARSAELGASGRSLVLNRFSLEAAAKSMVSIYETALLDTPRFPQPREVLESAGRLATHKVQARWESLQGRGHRDDFNANPL